MSSWVRIYSVIIQYYFILLLKRFQTLSACFRAHLMCSHQCGACWMLFESFLCFLPSSRISHFLQDSWFLLLENCIESQDLGTGHVRCFWSGAAARPPKMTEQENTCECISW